jgi:hypothetical protein
MNSVYVVVELQVTVNYIKTLGVAQRFYGKFRSSATVKVTVTALETRIWLNTE